MKLLILDYIVIVRAVTVHRHTYTHTHTHTNIPNKGIRPVSSSDCQYKYIKGTICFGKGVSNSHKYLRVELKFNYFMLLPT